MASDKERREVARRLRKQAEKLGPNMDAHEFAHYTADVLDVDENMTWYEMELRLVDLIEPATKCSEAAPKCDRDALLAIADELEQETGSVCGVCMGKTASRIREALGEGES